MVGLITLILIFSDVDELNSFNFKELSGGVPLNLLLNLFLEPSPLLVLIDDIIQLVTDFRDG